MYWKSFVCLDKQCIFALFLVLSMPWKKIKNRLAYKHPVPCMVSLCVRTRSRWRTAVSASVGLWTTSRPTRGPWRRSRSTVYWPTSSSCWWSALQSSVPAHLSWWSGCCQSCVPAVPIWLWSCLNKVGRIWRELIDWFIGVLHSICNISAIIKGGFGLKGYLGWYCDVKEIQFENCQNQFNYNMEICFFSIRNCRHTVLPPGWNFRRRNAWSGSRFHLLYPHSFWVPHYYLKSVT